MGTGTGHWSKWSKCVACLLMFAVALLFSGQTAEAKGKRFKVVSFSQSKSHSSVKCHNGECRSTSRAKASSSSRTIHQTSVNQTAILSNCPGSPTIQAFRSSTVGPPSGLLTGNLHAIAVAEASSGAPHEHVFTAREIADAAGVGSVFVGVGWRGQTCQHPGRPSAEATVGNKTVRIWIL